MALWHFGVGTMASFLSWIYGVYVHIGTQWDPLLDCGQLLNSSLQFRNSPQLQFKFILLTVELG